MSDIFLTEGVSIMNKTVLITGASTGIGYELSKIFSKNGYKLVLVSRNRQRLEVVAKEMEEQHGIQAKVIPKKTSPNHLPLKSSTMISLPKASISTCLSTMQALELMANSPTAA